MLTFTNIFNNSLAHFSLFLFITIIIATFFFLLIINIFYKIHLHKNLQTYKLIILFDFLSYLAFIFEVGLFSRTQGQPSNVYLLPFRFLFSGSSITRMRLIIFAALNLLYFIPYGFLLGFMTTKMKPAVSMYISLCISFITSFSLEFLQYISKRGHFETEDIILNALGGFLGCIIYLVLYYIYKLFKSHLNADA